MSQSLRKLQSATSQLFIKFSLLQFLVSEIKYALMNKARDIM